jgi:hypothetical protein
MSEFELVIDEVEWEAVQRRIVPFCDVDERIGRGMVLVAGSGGRRRWWSTDQHRMACWDADADERDYALMISPRAVASWPFVAGDTGQAVLRVRAGDDGVHLVEMTGAGGTFSSPLLAVSFPAVDEFAARFDELDGPTALVDAMGLHHLARLSREAPNGPFLDEDRPEPMFRLGVTAHGLRTSVLWHELGANVHELPGQVPTGHGYGEVPVNPRFLAEATEALDPGDVTVVLPVEPATPIRIVQGQWSTYLMPQDELLPIVDSVEAALVECFGPDVLLREDDGDYVLSAYGVPVYARILAGDPARLRIFALVIEDVDDSAELLAEVNALNNGYGFVKVVWHERMLVVEGDLVAETMDAPEAMALYDRVRHVADELGPSLAAVYGGRTVQRGDHARWANYLRTAVVAELAPGERVDLCGRDAVIEWPFPGEVFGVTAWNPFGRRRSAELNEEQTVLLAADLFRAGATIIRADGRSYDDEYAEGGLLVWGVEGEIVRAIARQYEQEAIYRIDADVLAVLGVFSDAVSERGRLDHRGAID